MSRANRSVALLDESRVGCFNLHLPLNIYKKFKISILEGYYGANLASPR